MGPTGIAAGGALTSSNGTVVGVGGGSAAMTNDPFAAVVMSALGKQGPCLRRVVRCICQMKCHIRFISCLKKGSWVGGGNGGAGSMPMAMVKDLFAAVVMTLLRETRSLFACVM